MRKAVKRYTKGLLHVILWSLLLLFINILAQFAPFKIDLTEDERYTLTEPTIDRLKALDDIVHVKILLDGDFPAGFKRLQRSTQEMLESFRRHSLLVEYEMDDPNIGTVEERNARRKSLAEVGILPVSLQVRTSDETSRKEIYPYAILTYKGQSIPVSLAESQEPGQNDQVVINNSIALLEYKLIDAIKKLTTTEKPLIFFLEGKDGLSRYQTADLRRSLQPNYDLAHINLDSIIELKEEIGLLVIAKPRKTFTDRDKFILDQYIMNGGKVLWLIDRLNATVDSIAPIFVPYDYPLELEDQLFKYGIRIQPNLLLDLQCSRIPLASGKLDGKAKFELFKWYYHPVITAKGNHPIVKSVGNIDMQFPSRIDTIKTKTSVEKTILLTTSPYTREQFSPVQLNFDILNVPPKPEKFDKGPQPVAVLLEGTFPSLYENRVTAQMQEGLNQLGKSFKAQSEPTKMIVISDGDVAKNLVDPTTKKFSQLGYNRFEQFTFANKPFLINCIEYLLDEEGLLAARQKEIRLRLLDTVRAQEEKNYWQFINVGVPLLFLIVFGFLVNTWRKRRYGR